MGVDDSLGINGPAGEHHVASWVKVHLTISISSQHPTYSTSFSMPTTGTPSAIIDFTEVTVVGAAGINLLVTVSA